VGRHLETLPDVHCELQRVAGVGCSWATAPGKLVANLYDRFFIVDLDLGGTAFRAAHPHRHPAPPASAPCDGSRVVFTNALVAFSKSRAVLTAYDVGVEKNTFPSAALTSTAMMTRVLLAEARGVLREKFFAADVGITGANFLVAETGTSVIVTNEGNGDLTQTPASCTDNRSPIRSHQCPKKAAAR
jgi:hypothetical protein